MPIAIVGISHKTAALPIRERFALDEARLGQLYAGLPSEVGVDEMVVLSTCNRTEIMVPLAAQSSAQVKQLDLAMRRMDRGQGALPKGSLYLLRGKPALQHLLEVSAGIDSQVLGETQILGQVKEAYQRSVERHLVGALFHGLFQRAFRAAKEARTHTDLGRYPASVPSVALELARRAFPKLEERSVLLLGAGEMGQLTADLLKRRGVGSVLVCNRTLERARFLAQRFGGGVLPFTRLAAGLATVDLVVCCASASEALVTLSMARMAVKGRGGEPLVLIDLSVPRGVDPQVSHLPGALLHDLDSLQGIAHEHQQRRAVAGERARGLLERHAQSILDWALQRIQQTEAKA
jgi:glutamyl-tRNA reductase